MRVVPMTAILTAAAAAALFICAAAPSHSSPPSAARPAHAPASPFASYHDIFGVTAQEAAAIEAFRLEGGRTFTYGMSLSTEAFLTEGGAAGGYSALLCRFLTDLIGVPFELAIYERGELLSRFSAGEIDFTGDLTITDERKREYYMTSTIAERSLKVFRIEGAPHISDIAKLRPPRLVFTQGFAPFDDVKKVAGYAFESIFVSNREEAYAAIKGGEADAYLTMNVAELALDRRGAVVSETFYPLIFASTALSAQRSELAPIISVVDKALLSGGATYLAELYALGYRDYTKHRFLERSTIEEREYIRQNPVVRVATEYDNYPLSFYSRSAMELQGIAIDVMREMGFVTGLSFEVVNKPDAGFSALTNMVESGEASMVTAIMRSKERERVFLLPSVALMVDCPALISRSELPHVSFNELSSATIGIVRGTLYSELFKRWFPNNSNFKEYDNMDGAFNALKNGEVDMFMAMSNYLLSITNYKELAGYKVNIAFDNHFDITFGVSKDDAVLRSVVDKAMQIIDIEAISKHWMRKSYDYRAKLAEARLPWLIGAAVFSLVTLALILVLFYRSRDLRHTKAVEESLNRQNALMNTVNAAAAALLEPDTDDSLAAITSSMEVVCSCVDVDRVYFWQNVRKDDGRLYYKQIAKWSRPKYDMGIGLTEFAYEDTLPSWEAMFFLGKSINGPFETIAERERDFFPAYGLRSLLAVPLFLKDELWGFVSFDDCHKSHFFSATDEHILRSWGLLLVGAMLRGNIMRDLERAVAEAKSASSEAIKAYAAAEGALEAKNLFMANMNHEMRTPMNVIVGLTDLLLEEEDINPRVKETLYKINTAGNTLMGLISDVLDISKVDAGKMELTPVQYDVASFLNDIVALNAIRIEEKPIVFRMDVSEDLPRALHGDDLRVKQILNNLLSNAFKYTRAGMVTLHVDCERDGEIVWTNFCVTDTGIGIRAQDIGELFSDYHQVDARANRRIEGTGLGLSITKRFVELMGGEISVESEYGKWTKFRVRIRQEFVTGDTIGKENAENLRNFRYLEKKRMAHKKLARADLSYARALVVDDFPTNLDVAAGMLRKYKMQVDCVTNGQASIDLIAAGTPVYNAIFMDHMMPEMDGIEAAKAIRAIGTEYAKSVPIIALTANAVAGNEQMFLENGFDAFLSKPFNVMTLDSVIQRYVRDKEREQAITQSMEQEQRR